MDPNIMFVAGRIAGERGWTDATLVTVAQLPSLEPTGVPLVLVAGSDEIDALNARLVSSVDYVARPIMVVTDRPLVPAAAKWINPDIVRSVEGQDVPKMVPVELKKAEEPSAHERREQEKLEELKKIQPTPHLVPDQPKTDTPDKSGDAKADDKAKPAANKGKKPPPPAKATKTEDKAGSSDEKKGAAPAAKPAPDDKSKPSTASSKGGQSKGKASAEALREFRSLASD